MSNTRKHAYCILAHHEPELLKTLVRMVDDERNDIYIHIDAKAGVAQFANISARHSNLNFVKDRIDVNWGGLSQVRAELSVLDAAMAGGSYAYYHLLSGVDLPLKNQDYIHELLGGAGAIIWNFS